MMNMDTTGETGQLKNQEKILLAKYGRRYSDLCEIVQRVPGDKDFAAGASWEAAPDRISERTVRALER